MEDTQIRDLDEQMPCGRCVAGTYDYDAVLNGLAMFGESTTKREALKIAPRCQIRPTQICMGARDFIMTAKFPLNGQAIRAQLEKGR